jgi:hypothetical protein
MQGEAYGRTLYDWPAYTAGQGQPGDMGGGTIVGHGNGPTQEQWESIFGPGARDIKFDKQAFKRDGRLHLPSVLDGVNHYLTDKIDGLITDATYSPFTSIILPYKYLPNPDAKFTWNRYSFDEGLASRVPYESAARTMAQTRKSYEGYTVRQGLAITMEHNFMMSPAGRENFFNKWWQVVGSIQKTNDLDVHIALLNAPTYAAEVRNKYYMPTKTPHQILREHVDMFGFMQKNVNALDILIEESKITLQQWGVAQPPTFLLCNSKLTMQLTMTPERTNFITQGYDGIRRLKQGPMLPSYRDLSIVHSRAYPLETGAPPRDLLRRRVRVAEYCRIPWQQGFREHADDTYIELYDESRDTFFRLSYRELLLRAALDEQDRQDMLRSLTYVPPGGYVDHRNKHAVLAARYNQIGPNEAFDNANANMEYGILNFQNRNTWSPNNRPNMATIPQRQARYVYKKYRDAISLHEFARLTCGTGILACLPDGMEQFFSLVNDNHHQMIVGLIQQHFLKQLRPENNVELVTYSMLHVIACNGPPGQHPGIDAFLFTHFLQTMSPLICLDPTRELPNCPQPVPNNDRWNLVDVGVREMLRSVQGAAQNVPALCRALNTYCMQDAEEGNTAPPASANLRVFESVTCNQILAGLFHAINILVLLAQNQKLQYYEFGQYMSAQEAHDKFDNPDVNQKAWDIVIVRPNIEHNMLAAVLGRGGDELGNTFWGQTELSCYDDSMHGVWGMSYKYHERAIVTNEKNLIRLFDIAYDGYNGGKDDRWVNWMDTQSVEKFKQDTINFDKPYDGDSMMVMAFPRANGPEAQWAQTWPSPIVFHDTAATKRGNDFTSAPPPTAFPVDPDNVDSIIEPKMHVFATPQHGTSPAESALWWQRYKRYFKLMPNFTYHHRNKRTAGHAGCENEATVNALAFQMTYRLSGPQGGGGGGGGAGNGIKNEDVKGSGHHGVDYIGVASVRNGKGYKITGENLQTMRQV